MILLQSVKILRVINVFLFNFPSLSHCLSPKYVNYINFHIKELHRTQENQYQNEEKELSELPSSGLVNAQACEARIAEKIITARHKCGYCLAILSGESD